MLQGQHLKMVLTLCTLSLLLQGCKGNRSGQQPGYVEGEYVRIASSVGGRLVAVLVERGANIKAATPLFQLEQENELAALKESEQRLSRAQAVLENLKKGKRADEIDVIKAQYEQALVQKQFTEKQLLRQTKLSADNLVSKENLDQLRSQLQREQARLEELKAQLRTATLGARQDEISAAEADVAAARAVQSQAQWRLSQKIITSATAGVVDDVLFRVGEMVPAGTPVVNLLPPENIKVRFFLPEGKLKEAKIGRSLAINCDGCEKNIEAKVSYISSKAEFTPPVIYSKENRAKLVYMIEAKPTPKDAALLHPGQPIEIEWL